MEIKECAFCSRKIYPGRGILFVDNFNHNLIHCSRKCFQLTLRKKNPRSFAWTQVSRKLRNKETHELSVKLNNKKGIKEPVRYNRTEMLNTLRLVKTAVQLRTNKKVRLTAENRLRKQIVEKAALRKHYKQTNKKITDKELAARKKEKEVEEKTKVKV